MIILFLEDSMNSLFAHLISSMLIINCCLSKSTITDIVIPFHPRQIKEVIREIEWWKTYPLTNLESTLTVQVTFFSSGPPNNEIQNIIQEVMSEIPFLTKRSIKSYNVEFASIPRLKDSYLEGSKIQWEMFMNHDRNMGLTLEREGLEGRGERHKVDHALYLEPDCHPIQIGWLDILNNITENDEKFWMKGSLFRGQGSSHNSQIPFNIFHINGNAIYNLNDPLFINWYFEKVKPFIKSTTTYKTPYDTDLFRYFLQKENWKSETRHILHKFKLTNLIQNHWHSKYNIKDLLSKTPNLAIIHGGQNVIHSKDF